MKRILPVLLLAGCIQANQAAHDLSPPADLTPATDGANLDAAGFDGAVAPALVQSSEPQIAFGQGAIGSHPTHALTLTNSGGAAATALVVATAAPFSVDGGCGATLAPGASCTVMVGWTPVAADSGALTVGYSGGLSLSIPLTGSAAAPANLTISDGDFGVVTVGASLEKTLTVSNSGGVPAEWLTAAALSLPFGFAGGVYPGVGGTCADTLAPLDTCTIVVAFAPTAAGAEAGELDLGYDDGAGAPTATCALTGAGIAAASLQIENGPSFSFGTVATGAPIDQSFTITNVGGVPATAMQAAAGLTAPFAYAGGGGYPGQGGSCGATLSVFASCTVVVRYTPVAGPSAATLAIGFDDGAQPRVASIAVGGTGTAHGFLTISDADFGTRAVGSSTTRMITLRNSGGANVGSLSPEALAAPFVPGGSTCSSPLVPGASCTVSITFTPPAVGDYSATVTIDYNDGAAARSATSQLAGHGTASAFIDLGGGALDFAARAVGSSTDSTVTVANTGASAANTLGVHAPSPPFTLVATDCPSSLAAGVACSATLRFSPAALGSAAGSLTVGWDAGSAARALTGVGVSPAQLALSDAPGFDFGARALGSSSTHAFILGNSGGVAAGSLAVTAPAAPFGITANTCGATLGPSQSCQITVSFQPSQAGAASGSLRADFNDGAMAASLSRALTGSGAPPATLALSDSDPYDYGTRAIGASSDHSFVVSNSGGVPATAITPLSLAAGFAWAGGSFPGQGGTCAATLDGGASCTLVVRFSPTGNGAVNGQVALAYADGLGQNSVERAVTGTGAQPAGLNAGLLDFGARAVGSTATATITVTNGGGVAATALSAGSPAAPFAYAGGSYPGQGGTCAAGVAAQASCTLVVSFAPVAAGAAQSLILINFDSGAGPSQAKVSLAGAGTDPALLLLSDGATYDFGTVAVGQHLDHIFFLTNGGGLTAGTVGGEALAAPFAYPGGYPGQGGTCGASLAPGASCALRVRFTPSVAAGASATLTIDYNDGVAARQANRPLTGAGTNHSFLVITDWPQSLYSAYGLPPDPATFDFGAHGLGSDTPHSFVVTNTGAASATAMVASTSVSAPFALSGAGSTCGATLAAGASCTLTVDFQPTAASAASSNLRVDYSDGTATRPLAGTGTNKAVLAVTDFDGINLGAAYDFGTQGVNSSTDKSFYVRNGGGAPATSLGGGAFGAGFTWAGGSFPGTGGTCGASLGVGASCTVAVRFTPPSPGPFSSSAVIDYDDGGGPTSARRDVHGAGTAAALITFNDDQGGVLIYDLGPRGLGTSTPFTISVINSGGATAQSLQLAVAGSAYHLVSTDCGAQLAAGQSCHANLSFTPTAGGAADGSLTVTQQSGSATRALTGTGTDRAYLVLVDDPNSGGSDPRGYDFGVSGVPTDHTFTVINQGGAAATSIQFPAPKTPFSIVGGAAACTTLAAGASCAIQVRFTPSGDGAAAGELDVDYLDPGSPGQVSRTLLGTSTTRALLIVRDCDSCGGQDQPYDFGSSGQPSTHTFTVANVGGGAATPSVASGLGGEFGFPGGGFSGGGTCAIGTPIAAGASCTVVVQFSPNTANPGTRAATLAVDYQDSTGAGPTATRALQGTASNRAIIKILSCENCGDNGNGSIDFGTAGQPETRTLFVVNEGVTAASLTSTTPSLGGAFSFPGGGVPGSGGTCVNGGSLAAGAGCTLTVVFTPSGNGLYTQPLSFDVNDGFGLASVSVTLQGTATTQPLLNLGDNSGGNLPGQPFDFGSAAIAIDHTFFVANSGGGPAVSLQAPADPGPGFAWKGGAFPGSGGTCAVGGNLPAGASCLMVVTFLGSGAPGARSGAISLVYNGGVGASRGLTGTVIDQPLVQFVNPPSGPFDFGTAGTPIRRTLSVQNLGAGAVTLGAATAGAPFSFEGGSPGPQGTCGASLASGATCDLTVTFTPSGAPGVRSATVSLPWNGGSTASLTVTGTVTDRAQVSISDGTGGPGNPGGFDYGQAGVPVAHTFYVNNLGGAAATLGPAGGLGTTFQLSGGTCGGSLGVGASCTLGVTFVPSGDGPRSSLLRISVSDSQGAQADATRALSGTAVSGPLLQLTTCPGCGGPLPASFDFGTSGVALDQVFYLVNLGGAGATLSPGATGAAFNYSGGSFPGTNGSCGATLGSGANCTISYRFTPSGAAGPRSDTLSFGYAPLAGGASQLVQLALQGAVTTQPLLFVSDWPPPPSPSVSMPPYSPYDFGVSTAPLPHTFYVVNQGGAAATALADLGFTGAPHFRWAGGGAFPGAGGNCDSAPPAPGASCSVVVEFDGTGTTATTWSGQLQLGWAGGTVTRDLRGTDTNRGYVEILDDPNQPQPGQGSYEYGTAGVPVPHTFTLKNLGVRAAGSFAPAVSGGDFSLTSGPTCSSLAPGASCTLVVSFSGAGTGDAGGSLTLGYDDGLGAQTSERDLHGTATRHASVALSGNSTQVDCNGSFCGPLGVGAPSGSSSPFTVWVFNLGGAAANAPSLSGVSTPFSVVTNGCSGGIPAGASCAVTLAFSPSAPGSFSGSITLSYVDANGGAAAAVTRGLSGMSF